MRPAANETAAATIMHELNPQALVAWDGDHIAIIEDVTDPDGRMFRLEYESAPDGSRASGFCRSNPWNRQEVTCGHGYSTAHVHPSGFLCLGRGYSSRSLSASPFNLSDAVKRSRFWCTAFSVFMETGAFPSP